MRRREQERMVEYTLQYTEDREYLLYRLMLDYLEDVPGQKELAAIEVTYPRRAPRNAGDGGCIRAAVPLSLYDFMAHLHDFMRTEWRYSKDYLSVMRKTKAWIAEYSHLYMYSSRIFQGS